MFLQLYCTFIFLSSVKMAIRLWFRQLGNLLLSYFVDPIFTIRQMKIFKNILSLLQIFRVYFANIKKSSFWNWFWNERLISHMKNMNKNWYRNILIPVPLDCIQFYLKLYFRLILKHVLPLRLTDLPTNSSRDTIQTFEAKPRES